MRGVTGAAAQRAWWPEELSVVACRRCGESHPACVVLYPAGAAQSGGRLVADLLVSGWDAGAILAEAAGSRVLCKNCRRKELWEGHEASPE
jgi:hypothetical protein